MSLSSCLPSSSEGRRNSASPSSSPFLMSRRPDSVFRSARSGSSVDLTNRAPHVVILGAGYAGSMLARGLADLVKRGVIRLTVIDRRNFMHHKIASFRTSVSGDESWVKRCHIPLEAIVKYGRIVVGEVSRVCEKTKRIHFHDAEQSPLHFDILVAATGVLNLTPGELPNDIKLYRDMKRHFERVSHAIQDSSRIVIVGAGPGAIQLAGEIRARYADKEITLITASSTPMSSCVAALSNKFHIQLREKLQQLRIRIIYNERVVQPTFKNIDERDRFLRNTTVNTDGNLSLPADLLIWSAPVRTRTEVFPVEWINELGELTVEATFQLRGYPEVFAFGDVTSLPETKQAETLPSKVPVIVHNIEQVAIAIQAGLHGSMAKSLKKYRVRERELICLPLGPEAGVSQITYSRVVGDKYTSDAKGKDLMSDQFWSLLTGRQPSDRKFLDEDERGSECSAPHPSTAATMEMEALAQV